MTYTARIRLYLIIAAVLPPLLIIFAIYMQTSGQVESSFEQEASKSLESYYELQTKISEDLCLDARQLLNRQSISDALKNIQRGRITQVDLSRFPLDFDFVEILNGEKRVLASYHRPGLIGQTKEYLIIPTGKNSFAYETVEYDIKGRHAANACTIPWNNYFIYTGRYIDSTKIKIAEKILGAEISIYFAEDSLPGNISAQTDPFTLYEYDDRLYSLLAGGPEAGFYMTALFTGKGQQPVFTRLMSTAGVAAGLGIIIAILLGIYITAQTKREIHNLINAAARVAGGDFGTPVMAYEEGEFSRLADSFSDMMYDLRNIRDKLSMSEKIAAWKTIGQKVAHEIKNPLTPIMVSVDDLRRSHAEKIPEFDKTLEQTTLTIKTELNRLNRLLDQFVRFARMNPPEIEDVSSEEFITGIKNIYKNEIESDKLTIINNSNRRKFRLDPEMTRQILINLVKNGLEAAAGKIEIKIEDTSDGIEIIYSDNGPGFNEEILERKFQPYVTTKKDGSGLGLAIIQRIIYDHGGSVDLFNREEGGAGLTIRLPM